MVANRAKTESIAPLFIVRDLKETVDFYTERMGFEVDFSAPDSDPFFAILRRDAVMIFMKQVAGVGPMPNHQHHPWFRWDAYVNAPQPDALLSNFRLPEIKVSDFDEDGLRGFEVEDPNGYVLFFGCPK